MKGEFSPFGQRPDKGRVSAALSVARLMVEMGDFEGISEFVEDIEQTDGIGTARHRDKRLGAPFEHRAVGERLPDLVNACFRRARHGAASGHMRRAPRGWLRHKPPLARSAKKKW